MKWTKQVLCVLGGVVCFLGAQWMSGMEDIGKQGYIKRNTYGEEVSDYPLVVEGFLEEKVPLSVQVQAREYEEQEAAAVFDEIMSGIGNIIAGNNPGLMEVREDLNLVTQLPQYGVKLKWSSSDAEVLNSFGQIRAEEIPQEGITLGLTVLMSTGTYEEADELEVRIYPPILTDRELGAAKLREQLQELEKTERTQEVFRLPETLDGKQLSYREQADTDHEMLLVLGVILAVLCYAQDRKKAEDEKKKRSRELMEDYAEIVFKLMVFIGAGMTVYSAWERLALDYEAGREQERIAERAGYEEMHHTYRQIQSGVPEGQAYVDFGKRCRLQPYLKLSSVLEQNRKTGTKNLRMLLESEMADAWEQRKSMAKKLGEEAGTKLLVPLFMMLGIVMVIIMVPAMLSMSM